MFSVVICLSPGRAISAENTEEIQGVKDNHYGKSI
jgi:hypothetical protein